MAEIIRNLIQMDPTEISNYVNYFFIAIAIVALIGFLIGFIKGLYKEASTFIVTAIYLVVIVFVNRLTADAIFETDISGVLAQNNFVVSDSVKTVGDLFTYYFKDICEQNGIIIGNSEQMVHSIISISLTFINLVVYLVYLIAGIFICFVLDMLVYFLIIRLVVPKMVRKKKKLRVVGGAMGLLRYVVAFSLLLSPFTALVNSTVGKLRDDEGKIQRNDLDNDYYNALMNVLEGYNNSAVAKLFFVVTDDEGRSIDVQLMDYITNSKLDEETVISLYDEIGNLGALTVSAVATGAFETTGSIDYSLLLSAELVGSVIDYLANSTLIQTLLAVGLTLVTNMEQIKQEVDLSSIDFFSVNWDTTFDAIQSAYQELYDSGLISEVVNNSETFLNEFYLDGEYADSIKETFKALGDNELVCEIMPLLVVSFLKNMQEGGFGEQENLSAKRANNFEIKDELLDVNTYKDIKWGSELASIYEVFEGISKQYYAYENKHLSIGKIQTLGVDKILNTLFGVGIDFTTSNDKSYADQYENNVFINGGTFLNGQITHIVPGIKNILGINGNGGLLNLQIIDTMFEYEVFNDMISIIDINSMLQMGDDDIDLNEKVVDVISGWNKVKWQEELGCIVDVVAPIMKLVDIVGGEDAKVSEAKRAAQEDSSSMDLETILSDDSLNCLKRVTDVLNKSEIFTEILPDILESYTDKLDQELIPGLAMSDLNFTYFVNENETMVTELRSFIDDVDDINEDLVTLIDDLQGENAIEALVNDCASDNSVLATLLKTIEGNQIFNKELTNQEKANGEYKTFTEVMANVLGETNDSSQQMNIYNMTDGKVSINPQTIYDFEENEDGWDNEINGLVGFIGSLKGTDGEDQVILDYLTGKTSEDFDLGIEIFGCGNEIERIFASVDKSKILKDAFPGTFKELIGTSFEDVIGGSPDFYNVECWADEGHYFNLLLTNIDCLRENNQSLTEIDWLNVEEEKIVNILTSLYNTQSVGGSYVEDERENGVFHKLLKNIMGQALESLEIKITDCPEEDIISRDFDIDGSDKVLYDIYNGSNVYVSWLGDTVSGYEGEIKNIAGMISAVKDLPTEVTLEDDKMNAVLEKVNNSYVLRSTLGLIIESKTEEFKNQDDPLMKEFINRSDFEVFHKENLSLTPYDLVNDVVIEKEESKVVTSRKSEIELRQNELDNIMDILQDAEEISKELERSSEGNEFDKINELLENREVTGDETKPVESKIEVMLNNMHDSEIFNSLTHDELGNRVLTAFEYFFQYILDDESFTIKGKALLVSPTVEEIDEITSDTSLGLEDGWVDGESIVGEITNFNNSLYNAINNPLVDIRLDESLNFIEALQGNMSLKNEDGTNIGRDTTKTPIQDLLLDLYDSRILRKSNAHLLDNHIVNYLLDSIGYKEDNVSEQEDNVSEQGYKYKVIRNIYSEKIDPLSNEDLANKFGLAGVDAKKLLWSHEGKAIEDLIFAIDSDLSSFDINSFDSEFITNLIEPLERSYAMNYLSTTDGSYKKEDYRSIAQLVVIKIVNTSLDAFENLGLYIDDGRISNRLIKDYSLESGEAKVACDLIDAYKIMNRDDNPIKFIGGKVSFTDDKEMNKAFMDEVMMVLKPLYESDVYHNVSNLTEGDSRISKVKNKDTNLTNLTLFEQVVYTMLSSSNDLNNELYYDDGGIEYPEGEIVENGKDVINLRIREVSDLDAQTNSTLHWIELGSNSKVTYQCELGKVHEMAGYDLDSILNPAEGKIDLTSIVKDITNSESEDSVLNTINASYIMHDIVPHVISKYVSTHGSEGESVNENTIVVDDLIFLKGNEEYKGYRGYCGEKIDSYLIEHSCDKFEDRVEHWNNDLYYVSQLTLLFDKIEENSKITEGTSVVPSVFEDLLYNLSKTETYKYAIPQILISILNDKISVELFAKEYGLGEFITGDNDPEKLMSMYNVIDDSNNISDEPTTYISDVWKKEGEGIDTFINYLKNRDNSYEDNSKMAMEEHMYTNFKNKILELNSGV